MDNLKAQTPLRFIKEQYMIGGNGGNYIVRTVAVTGRQTGLDGTSGSPDVNLTN